jgi:4,5-dihydroxyphthalate decarboxylase
MLLLSLACGRYDRTEAILDGRVKPQGVDLTCLALPPYEMFWRQIQHREFDASELSLSAHILAVSRGERGLLGIPVFPSRVFRHSYIFVRDGAGIDTPQDLAGKRVGLPEYHMTAALFIRGLLSDDYGVEPQTISWVQAGLQQAGRKERVQLDLPEGVSVERNERESLIELLAAGRLDAVAIPSVPRRLLSLPGVRRLFPDVRAAERSYFERTGIFPIMHLLVIRAELYDRAPWLALELYKAFDAAKELALDEASARGAIASSLPWFQTELEETRALLGDDFWPYGLEANRATLEAAVRYSAEQGLSDRQVEVEELFVPNCLEIPLK